MENKNLKENKKELVAEEVLESVSKLVPIKTKGVAYAEWGNNSSTNPWTDARKSMGKPYDFDKFVETTNLCRFFYRTEPVVSTVINKLVEIGINDLVFSKNKLSDNEFRVFKSLKPALLEFAEQMAQEFLLSGLVVPEIGYGRITDKEKIFSLGVKKLNSLIIPDSMSVRDPRSVKIYSFWLSNKPSYFIKIPDELIQFIKNKGKFADGKEDKVLFDKLKKQYPDFVKEVLAGETEIPLENEHVLRRKYTADNQYPIPYISSSLDALQHKRKLRRMDYSLIDKVISAILHVKVGSDDFPITESPEDQEYLDELRNQLRMRGNSEQLMERIFQLLTNHTVELKWVFPDTATLLDQEKYSDINQEILFGLGFPRILITGESARTATSDPELALIGPIKTMENFRAKIIEVIKNICAEVSMRNGFKNAPMVEFKALNLHSFKDFMDGLSKLYDASALSRTDLANVYGIDFIDQLDKLEIENDELESRGLSAFGPSPFSSNQGVGVAPGENPQETSQKEENPTKNKADKKTKSVKGVENE